MGSAPEGLHQLHVVKVSLVQLPPVGGRQRTHNRLLPHANTQLLL